MFCEKPRGGASDIAISGELWNGSGGWRGASTISLDLTDYDYVIVMFKRAYDVGNVYIGQFCKKGSTTTLTCYHNNTSRFRQVTVTNSGLTFTDGHDYSMSGSTNNGICTPGAVYGVVGSVDPTSLRLTNVTT